MDINVNGFTDTSRELTKLLKMVEELQKQVKYLKIRTHNND